MNISPPPPNCRSFAVPELIKNYSILGVHYQDLQARVHEQETRNLTLHEAQPSAVLNFEQCITSAVLKFVQC